MPTSFYRPDVDGLRAVAVLVVLFFHLDLTQFSGGFIGVDVFLVISGYLITRLLSKEIDNGSFGFTHFWERRVRRLFPAMLVMLGITVIVSLATLFPSEYRAFAKSVGAQSVLMSNILFWNEAGYFDAPSHFKPLLHTWSLSLEEQFYLLFPVLLVLGFKLRVNRFALLLGLFSASLLAYNTMLTIDASAAFFLLPFRAWEFLVGALLASSTIRPATPLIGSLASISGLVAILYASVVFDGQKTHGLIVTLVPSLGAAAVIWGNCGNQVNLVGRLLSAKPVVFIGLISYSLYLWHWPIIVLSNYHYPDSLLTSPLVLGALSIAAGYLSWRYVEQPFRSKRFLSTVKPLFITTATIYLGIVALALGGVVLDKTYQRFPEKVLALADVPSYSNPRRKECHLDERKSLTRDKICSLGPTTEKPRFIVWGDSHADAIMPLFDQWARDTETSGLYSSYSGCPSLFDIYRVDSQSNHQCHTFNNMLLDEIDRLDVPHIVLVSRWSFYPLDSMIDALQNGERPNNWLTKAPLSLSESKQLYAQRFSNMLDRLQREGRTIWIVEQAPFQQRDVLPQRLASNYWRDPSSLDNWGITRDEHENRQQFSRTVLTQETAKRGNSLRSMRPDDYLCNESNCPVVVEGVSNYRDDDHISRNGALRLRPMLTPLLQAIKKGR